MQVGRGGTPTVKREGISDKPVSFLSGPVLANWVVPRVSKSFSSHRDVKLFYLIKMVFSRILKTSGRKANWVVPREVFINLSSHIGMRGFII